MEKTTPHTHHTHTRAGQQKYHKVQFAKRLLGGNVIMLRLQNVQQRLETNKLRAINLCLDECGRCIFFFYERRKTAPHSAGSHKLFNANEQVALGSARPKQLNRWCKNNNNDDHENKSVDQ